VESLDFDDEKNGRLEGKFLSKILHLGRKESIYYYIRTKKELEEVLEKFKESEYRYLHLSCHWNETAIFTTLDQISFSELNRITKPYLRNRRLFISACCAVNDEIARTLIPSSKCLSIIDPAENIAFNDAAIIWASFYHLVFKENTKKMKRTNILSNLKKVAKTFDVSLNYYSISRTEKAGFKKTPLPKKQFALLDK
jgi:hypothetical protein